MGREKGNVPSAWHSAASGSILPGFAKWTTSVPGLTASQGYFHLQRSICKLS